MRLSAVLFALSMTACGSSRNTAQVVTGETWTQVSDTEEFEGLYRLSGSDVNVDPYDAEHIEMEEGEVVWITEPGKYIMYGYYKGQVRIDVQDEIVHLIIQNAQIWSSYNGPAILVDSAAKVVITIPEETESTIADTPYYDEYPDVKASIYANSSLTINGGGRLTVKGFCRDAIRSKEELKCLDVTLNVVAKDTCLKAKECVVLQDAKVDLQAEKNGIRTTKTGKAGRGYVVLSGGSVQITGGEYGILSAENVYLRGCDYKIQGVLRDIDASGEIKELIGGGDG